VDLFQGVRSLARLADALHAPADLDQPLCEPAHDMEAINDMGRVAEMTLDRGPVARLTRR